MDKLFDNIYKKFFLRDILSIFMSGFLLLLALLMIHGNEIESLTITPRIGKILITKDYEISIFSYGLLIGIGYAIGLIINRIREWAQCRRYQKNISTYNSDVKTFYKKFNSDSETKDDFERRIVMFQVTGNFAVAITFCLIVLIIFSFNWDLSLIKSYIRYSGLITVFVTALICFSNFKYKEHLTYLKEAIKEKGINETGGITEKGKQ